MSWGYVGGSLSWDLRGKGGEFVCSGGYKIQIMLGDLCKLSLVLVAGLLAWILQERFLWPEDFSRYSAPVLQLPPHDPSFRTHVRPALFQKAQLIRNQTHLQQPEDIAVSSEGLIYTGLRDGSVVTVRAGSNETTTLFQHLDAGSIYGLLLTKDEKTLYYATGRRGVVRLPLDSLQPEFLLEQLDGQPIQALNSLALDEKSQTLFMTISGPIPMTFSSKEALLSHAAGEVVALELQSGTVRRLDKELAFPNGIVYEEKTNSIIYSELNRFCIWKQDLSTGERRVLVENLFGMADNLKLSDNGDLLVGIVTLRDALHDFLQDKPALRKLLIYLPERVAFAASGAAVAGGLRVCPLTGRIKQYILGGATRTTHVTTLLERNGNIYLSSLRSPTILVLPSSAAAEEREEKGNSGEL